MSYKIYELLDNNRGQTYQDFTDGEEIRKSGWGFQPYFPSDGEPGFVNEAFVNLVEKKNDFTMRRPIFSMFALAEEFKKSLKNLPEYVNKANDGKKFFKNLINLQESLIKHGFYEGDVMLFEKEQLDRLEFIFEKAFKMPLAGGIIENKELVDAYMNKNPRDKKMYEFLFEDGASKFSTALTVGQDDFPIYNQHTTEPSIENNLDANSAMYSEDLEYSHVDDATQDEYVLNEKRQKAYMPQAKEVKVKDKCKLAGLGNTSAACNQGDVSNLEFSSIKEEIQMENNFKQGWSSYDILNNGEVVGVIEITNRDKYITLNKIEIKPEQRKRGYADEAIKNLIKYANNSNKIITLTPDNIWGANKEKLKKWYKSLGFIMNSGKNKDFQTRELMYKIPQDRQFNSNKFEGMGKISESVIDTAREIDKLILEELMRLGENKGIMELQELPFKNDVYERGGKIYSVGGAVRDEFLGSKSKDLDILVTGIPMEELSQIMSKYGKVDAVGKSFGILKWRPPEGEEVDVALPRTETATGEGGHKGFDVKSDHALPIQDDLRRRDFTINAIAKDINGQVIDPFNGMQDLQNKVIRVVNPQAFSDDPLRMLRAVQFAARFGFKIEPKTLKLIQDNAHRIKEIPSERILIELDKIVSKGDPYVGAFQLKNTKLFQHIFGQEASLYAGPQWNEVKTMAEFIYLLTHHVIESPSDFYRRQLKGDIETYKELRALEVGMKDQTDTPMKNRSTAYNVHALSPKALKSKLLPRPIQRASQEFETGRYPKTMGELDVDGNDLKRYGLEGVEIGNALKNLLLNVYADKVRNNKQDLINMLGFRPSENLNEGKKSKYSNTKDSLMRSKSIPKEMKEKIAEYLGGGSSYHEGGRVHGLKIPKVKGKTFDGVSLGADKSGFYVYTHRAASKRYESPDKIPQRDIDFIETTG